MSKGKQLWPGDEMATFFRAHIRRETALEGEAAERLAVALTKAVNRMLVREMPRELRRGYPKSRRRPGRPSKAAAPARSAGASRPSRELQSLPLLGARHALQAWPRRTDDAPARNQIGGKSPRLCRSSARSRRRNLKRTDDIRKAIVAGVERRLADRKAAAS